jgi:hypothetical protein
MEWQITTLMDNVEFYEPPRRRAQIRVNTWVEFNHQSGFRDRKRCGVVKGVQQDNTALVIDEHTGAEVFSNLY